MTSILWPVALEVLVRLAFKTEVAMIKAVLIFNNDGKPRLTKFFDDELRVCTAHPASKRPLTGHSQSMCSSRSFVSAICWCSAEQSLRVTFSTAASALER